MIVLRRAVLTVTVLLAAFATAARAGERRDLVAIPQSAQSALVERQVPVTFKAADFFLAEWSDEQQAEMRKVGIPFETIFHDVKDDRTFFLFELREDREPPASWTVLYRSGLNVVVAMDDAEARRFADAGEQPVRLWHEPHGWGPPVSRLVAFDCSYKALVAEILGKTTQTQWLDWVEKLSGAEPVDVGGTSYTIDTRYTSRMFSGAANAKAYDFVRQQAEAWGFSGANLEEDPYTTGATGKNLVLTIPGQTSSEVLLTGHLDTSVQTGDPSVSAPGANDNGTGAATLLEAARIFRRYRFDRTVKIVFFTGEEQGLYGSAAYVQDHPTAPMLGVVNLDMFGWDLNGDRCFEIHCGTLQASIDVGNCFHASLGAYGLGLSRDFLTSGATNRSDHASFWNAGVGAVEIAENYFSNGQAGGCVGSEPNPYYHTVNDKVATNMHPPYAFSIAEAALATISAMATPIEACFSSSPALGATGGVNEVELSWTPVSGAASYRVYRARNGCEGSFMAAGETADTSFADPIATPGTYSYRVEAVTADGRCVSAESNCVAATPTVYHATPVSAAYADFCPTGGPGSGDGIIDPGETVTMQTTLRNDSDTPLSSLAGTLTSPTAGVAILDAAASWPDLAAYASAATLPDHFHFAVAPATACGTALELDVSVSAAEGAWSGPLAGLVGAPGSTYGEFASTDVPKTIPDNTTVLSTLVVAGLGAVLDVNVGLTITHTYDADLDIYLRGPDGTRVELTTDNGSSGDNYTNTVFDDEALTAVTGGSAPFTGSYRPEGLLSGFDGRPATGTWTLEVADDATYDTGTLSAWSLKLTTSVPPTCRACAAPPPGEAGDTTPLTLSKAGADLVLDWGISPGTCGIPGYSLYRGGLDTLAAGSYSHDTVIACGLASATHRLAMDSPLLGTASYFLVVAENGTAEGSYGRASSGSERPVSAAACRPTQNLSACP